MQIGRLINHAPGQEANCRPHPPLYVRGKWRVGFVTTKEIPAGEEVTYDYNVRGEDWLKTSEC